MSAQITRVANTIYFGGVEGCRHEHFHTETHWTPPVKHGYFGVEPEIEVEVNVCDNPQCRAVFKPIINVNWDLLEDDFPI